MKKKFKVNLLIKIIVMIALGIVCGQFFAPCATRIFVTFNSIFGQLLGFMIPLIILGFVAPAISDVGKKAGKILLITAAIAYVFTSMAGFYSYGIGSWLFPGIVHQRSVETGINAVSGLDPYFTIEMPPLMSVMTALVLAFMLGIGMAFIKMGALKAVCDEFRDIVSMVIAKVIIPLLPLYIFGIFLNMTVEGTVAAVMSTFAGIIGIIFAMHILLLIFQYFIAWLFCGKNPFKCLLTMMPAYFTALGTQSSAATIPVTLRQTMKMGVSEDIAGFVVPLCANIHMSGSAMKIVACAMAIMLMEGSQPDPVAFSGFIMMLGISIVAAPGVPGGAIMASLGILGSILGFGESQQALMIALYITMDSFGTACNVTGDGAIALIINRFFK